MHNDEVNRLFLVVHLDLIWGHKFPEHSEHSLERPVCMITIIGIRTDDHFLKLLESASKMSNAYKSKIIRSTVARTYGMNLIQYETVETQQNL